MGQAVTGKFSLIAALSLGYDSNRNCKGDSDNDFINISGPHADLLYFCWQSSAICCGFTNLHRSVLALDLLLLCGRSFDHHTKMLQLVSQWVSCSAYCSLFEMTTQPSGSEKYHLTYIKNQ
jgi:hypothetical protein